MTSYRRNWESNRQTLGGWLIILIVSGLLAWSVVDEWQFAGDRIGVIISETDTGVVVDAVEPGLPAAEAGLEAGDVIRTIEGESLSTLAELDTLFERHHDPGEAISGTVERDDRRIEISLQPGVPVNIGGLLAKFVLVAAYLGLGALAARYRQVDARARILTIFVTLIALELSMPVGYTFGQTALGISLLLWLVMTGLQFGLELHLVSLIPRRLACLKKRPRLTWIFYVIGIGSGITLASLAIYQWYYAPTDGPPLLYWAETTVLISWAVSVAAILAWQAWRADSTRETNQALLVLTGLLPWAFYIVTTSLWSGWMDVDDQIISSVENLVLLIFPATVFLAIFRYGLFDVESLMRRGFVYGVVAALCIVLLSALLTTALPVFEQHFGMRTGQWLIITIAVIVGVSFRPLRHGIERLVERGLFPKRRALRHRLIQIARALSAQNQLEALILQLARDARNSLDLQWAGVVTLDERHKGLITAFSDGIDLPTRSQLSRLLDSRSEAFASLDRARRPITVNRLRRRHEATAEQLTGFGAEVLVPMYFQRRMIGILCLGRKQNGELFRREELELLDLFSHQIATSLENLRLFQDATYEELTGLLRREVVLRQLDTEAARSLRQQAPLSVVMIDLDHFKTVNDTHGHLFGDRILSHVAKAMRERIRAVDALGRYGGEEFLLVLPDTEAEGALKLAEALRSAVSGLQFQTPDQNTKLSVTISLGLASGVPNQTEDPQVFAGRLLRQADEALYEAKSDGRDRIVVRS